MNEFETNYQMLYFQPPDSQTCHSRALTIYWVGGRLMRITNAFEKHKDNLWVWAMKIKRKHLIRLLRYTRLMCLFFDF